MYSKLDKNINFYLSTFPAKINYEVFQNKGKILFCGHFWAYFVVFAQKIIFFKSPAKYTCSGSPVFQRYRADWPSNQK